MRKAPVLLLLLALLLAGCGGQPASDRSSPANATIAGAPSIRPGVELAALIEAGSSGNFAAVLDRLHPPLRTEKEPVENRHVPGQIDTLRTYVYDGLHFTVLDLSASKKKLLVDLTVTSDAYAAPQSVRVGMTQYEVEARLGAPDEQQDGAWIYHLGPEPTPGPMLHVRFDGDVVRALAWSFYVD